MFKHELIGEMGIVQYIYNNRALVEIEKPNAKECKSCGVCTGIENNQRHLEFNAIPGLHVGQRVRIQIIKPSPYKSILLILVFPLLSMFTGSLLGQQMRFLYPASANIRMISCGFILFVVSVSVASLYDKKIRGQKQQRKIISINTIDDVDSITQ